MPNAETLDVIIETPRGSRNKFEVDEKTKTCRLSKVLPAGFTFPYDFGFVPGTLAGDGDPLDILVLMDAPAVPGCVVSVRLLGAIEATQTENKTTTRNDRLIAVATEAHDYQHLRTLKDIETNLRRELEHFFTTYHQMNGVKFKILNLCGPERAKALIKKASQKFGKKKKSA
jgi:inorganic pyrophosphatase